MPGSTYSLYDSNGNRVLVQEQNLLDTSKITTRQMVYAADGTLLKKNDGTASSLSSMVNNKVQYATITAGGTAHHFSSNGNYLGEIAKDKAGRISSSLKDQHFTGATQNDSSNVIKYQVQSGDSLKSLALNFYGNADYWYLIANLNGLTSSPDEALSAGLSIDIPARASSSNSANSFKPMDLQKIIGDTTPSLPYVPPPPAAGCNAIATIVMVVVTVVVTAYAGPVVGAAAGDAARQTTTAMLNGQFDWGGFVRGNLNPLNMAKKAMMMSVPAYGAYELNKALQGNDRSQALFNPLEYGFDYDYKSTAIAAAASYAGSELGAGVGGAIGSTAGQVAGAMVQAGVSYASTVQLNRWAGRQMEFKLSAMAAGMAGAGITAGMFGADNVNGATPKTGPMAFNWREITKAIFSAETVQRFGIGMAQNAMQYGLGKLFGDRTASWNFGNAAADSFGNAIGNSIVKGLSSEGTFSAKEQAELDRKVAKVGNKELANLDARVRSGLQQNTNSIANDIGVRTAAEGAAAFDANVLAQLNAADMVMDSSLNKRLGAVDGYLDMSRKTLRDIQAIDTRAETNRQQRALQASKIQQRYDQKLMDFRMDNPVYRTPQPAYNWDNLIENAKETRMRSLGTSLYIDRSVSAQEKEFLKQGQLDELYYSRAQKHDPVANVGLGVWGSLEQNIDVHGVAGGLYWKGVGALTTFNSKMALATGRLTDTLVSAVVKGGPNQNAGVSLLNQVFNNDEIDRLNVQMANDVAKSHLQTVSRDFKYDTQGIKGLLSESQITRYHHDVFKSYDASIRYYGGTLGIGDSQGPVSDVIRRGLGVFYLYPAGDR